MNTQNKYALLVFAILVGSIFSTIGIQSTGALSSTQITVYSTGQIINMVELGTWFIQDNTLPPDGATYAVVAYPSYAGSRAGLKLILCWDYLISYDAPWTTANLQAMETAYKTQVPANKFWGILFLGEENYKKFITGYTYSDGSVLQGFDENMNITWFNENLQGYTKYLQTYPRQQHNNGQTK